MEPFVSSAENPLPCAVHTLGERPGLRVASDYIICEGFQISTAGSRSNVLPVITGLDPAARVFQTIGKNKVIIIIIVRAFLPPSDSLIQQSG